MRQATLITLASQMGKLKPKEVQSLVRISWLLRAGEVGVVVQPFWLQSPFYNVGPPPPALSPRTDLTDCVRDFCLSPPCEILLQARTPCLLGARGFCPVLIPSRCFINAA